MLDLYEELRAVTETLAAAGIPHALVGGLAYSFYVEARATEDIDFLIAEADWPAVCRTLQTLGFDQLAGPMDFETIRIRRLTKIAQADVLVLDFLLADELTSKGLEQPVMYPFGDTRIPLAPVEVIVNLKRRRMSRKDIADLEGLEDLLQRKADSGRD